MGRSRRDLEKELRERAGLDEEQARHAVQIFEEFLRRRAEESGGEEFRGLFTGSLRLFED
ncbi:hypothetical protein RxyAA322_05330 [Rubrobacter xylanophilus]|uniref:Uncharacterized protein n=1 Tax=Rubrobacter xylanophilus TaxID=49319 RepID=A0A510HFG5_9ACTN|nr:hypothetical protein [Rubrobacter xylanophilus]BBL78679.1 hypothetical protein RxyAA322_05330 [Rubrobacter xylanophilus]